MGGMINAKGKFTKVASFESVGQSDYIIVADTNSSSPLPSARSNKSFEDTPRRYYLQREDLPSLRPNETVNRTKNWEPRQENAGLSHDQAVPSLRDSVSCWRDPPRAADSRRVPRTHHPCLEMVSQKLFPVDHREERTE